MIQEHLLTISTPLDLLNDTVDDHGKENEANKNVSRRIYSNYVDLQQYCNKTKLIMISDSHKKPMN